MSERFEVYVKLEAAVQVEADSMSDAMRKVERAVGVEVGHPVERGWAEWSTVRANDAVRLRDDGDSSGDNQDD